MSQDARHDEELATQRRARILGLPYTNTAGNGKTQYPELIAPSELETLRAVPLAADQNGIVFGITNTTSRHTMEGLGRRFQDQRISFSLISDSGFREYVHLYNPPKQIVYEDITMQSAGTQDLQQRVSATLEQVRADDMLAYLVKQAHRLNASDIHLEAQDKDVRVRFRIDGVLHAIARLSREKYRILVSAVASAGNISTASADAQQGHIAHDVHMADGSLVQINLRLETATTVHGMDMVMRLFNMEQNMYKLEKLGLSESERAVVEDIIRRPTGLVLAVGPTGSGKTTTLYSILNSLNNEERKIVTIEDPVEYQFAGITQISVATQSARETSFAEKLRATLRLDPDIVMIGEIRDMDTAKTALQASLTGHLVLSTFHASSAAAALTRLMDVIGKNPLFMSAIRLIMAQRLVRRLDDASKQPYTPDEATLSKVRAVLDSLPAELARPDISNLQLYKPGSSEENPYGFNGQLAIRELLIVTDELSRIFEVQHGNFSTEELERAAVSAGMRTMLQDGVLKAIAGQTTLEEVYRVVG